MKLELFRDQPLFERLVKSNMTQLELMVASHAMQYHYSDPEHRFALVEAIQCDQAVLGIIGDFMIQVDAYDLTFTYTRSHTGYQISLRTCGEGMSARDIAAFVCRGIGTGGGHFRKAGGFIDAELLQRECGDKPVFDVILQRLRDWFAQREE